MGHYSIGSEEETRAFIQQEFSAVLGIMKRKLGQLEERVKDPSLTNRDALDEFRERLTVAYEFLTLEDYSGYNNLRKEGGT